MCTIAGAKVQLNYNCYNVYFNGCLQSNSWKYESNVWKRIAERYTSGELTDEDNEPFDVDPYEKLLIVTIKIGDSLYTKTFCDEAVIGS